MPKKTGTIKLIHSDCLEALKTLPDNSVDSLVTDPPAGIGFMGKAWDSYDTGRTKGHRKSKECLSNYGFTDGGNRSANGWGSFGEPNLP